MTEPTMQDLKNAVIQLDGKTDAILETLAHMSHTIAELEKRIYSLVGRVRELEQRLPDPPIMTPADWTT